MTLAGKTLFITGASRGIGLSIALAAAKRDGCNVAIAAKTITPHPKLPGTIYTAAEEVEKAGGKALALQVDIRDAESVNKAMAETADKFGGIDIVINNASAISLTDTEKTDVKRFDLMNSINTRGTWVTSKMALPYLKASAKANRNPHILNLSPPLSMEERWFAPHTAYSIAKYGMSLCVLGMAGEFRQHKIGVNALWPLTAINTAALQLIPTMDTSLARTTDILSDAAYKILTSPSDSFTGNFLIDEIYLRENGVTDLTPYNVTKGTKMDDLSIDFFIDDAVMSRIHELRKRDGQE